MLRPHQSIGMEPVFGEQGWDVTLPGQPGRISMACCYLLKGVVIISAYFWCSEGWSDRNEALMRQIAEKAAELSVPYILAADFNMTPSQLSQGWWFSALGGIIVAPDGPLGTCASAQGEHRVHDYFVVHPDLEPYIESVVTLLEYPSCPHKPVALTLRVSHKAYFRRVQKKPKPLPSHRPMGCAPPPKDWPRLPRTMHTEVAAQVWQSIITVVEDEVLRGVLG